MGVLKHKIGIRRYIMISTDGVRLSDNSSQSTAASAATQLSILVQPAGAVTGVPFATQPQVRLLSAASQPVLQSGIVITAYQISGTGVFTGTKTAVTNGSGIATFTNLTITGTGNNTIGFSALMSSIQNIWSDDVEIDRSASYFEIDTASGSFGRVSVGGSMQWRTVQVVSAQQAWGDLKLSIGRNPASGPRVGPANVDFGLVTVEFDMQHSVNNVVNSQDKCFRMNCFSAADWSTACAGHYWSNGTDHLSVDPVTTVVGSIVTGVGFNDFAHHIYLGQIQGVNPVFGATATTQRRYRGVMRLNDPGQVNGYQQLYINDVLDVQAVNLNLVGTYTEYGINTIFLENYSNNGIAVANNRMFDNISVTGQARAIVAANTINVGASGGSAWFTEDFSGYANLAALQSASWLNATDTIWSAVSGATLDTTEGYGTSTKCLLYRWVAGDPDVSGHTVRMNLPTSITDYWTEIWAKFSTDFVTEGSGANNPDYKFVFWALQPNDERNEIKVGNGGNEAHLDTRYAQGPDTLYINAANGINSGQWHRYRVHNKVQSGNNCIFSVEFWDGTNAPQLLQQTNFSLDNLNLVSMNYIVLGANRNKPPLTSGMTLRWGKVTLYNTDPGWGF